MKRIRYLSYCSFCIWLLCTSCSNPLSINNTITDRSARCQDYLRQITAKGLSPGIQYLVTNKDSTIFEAAAGQADVANKTSMTLDHVMGIFSVTKVFTAAAILQLIDNKFIGLDDSLKQYLPDAPYHVTLRQILSHCSGIPDPVWGNGYIHWPEDDPSFNRIAQLGNIMSENSSLLFAPRTNTCYSNLGYAILGRVIEIVTMQRYEHYMNENVLNKFTIDRTKMGFEHTDLSMQAKPYAKKSESIFTLELMMTERNGLKSEGDWYTFKKDWLFDQPAHGGMLADAPDLGAFLRDQLSSSSILFSDSLKNIFYTSQAKATSNNFDDRGQEYSIGWSMSNISGFPVYSHDGGGMGYFAVIRLYPTAGIGTVYLVNLGKVNNDDNLEYMNNLDRQFLQ